MIQVKLTELKNNISTYLRAVENGEEIEITRRDRPIARIVPLRPADKLRIIPRIAVKGDRLTMSPAAARRAVRLQSERGER
jgi:prevent-host-death family protein